MRSNLRLIYLRIQSGTFSQKELKIRPLLPVYILYNRTIGYGYTSNDLLISFNRRLQLAFLWPGIIFDIDL